MIDGMNCAPLSRVRDKPRTVAPCFGKRPASRANRSEQSFRATTCSSKLAMRALSDIQNVYHALFREVMA